MLIPNWLKLEDKYRSGNVELDKTTPYFLSEEEGTSYSAVVNEYEPVVITTISHTLDYWKVLLESKGYQHYSGRRWVFKNYFEFLTNPDNRYLVVRDGEGNMEDLYIRDYPELKGWLK